MELSFITSEVDKKIYSVSEVNTIIKMLIEDGLGEVFIRGEISNFKPAASGHLYFSLKDSSATIQAALFRGSFSRIKNISLKNGLEIICKGRVSVYPPRGSYQIIVENMELVGAGSLQAQFEELKKKLLLAGLFSLERKRTIPVLPKKIAVITSPSGAAIRDVISVLKRRHSGIEVIIIPSLVQGIGAEAELVEAIKKANDERLRADVILLTRGGGSIEDLWCFNSEILAHTIANSRLPVVSAVGHEIDFTIADFVADLRAPTPSAAAEILTKEKVHLEELVLECKKRIIQAEQNLLKKFQMQLGLILNKIRSPQERIVQWKIHFDDWTERLIQAMQNFVFLNQETLEKYTAHLHALSPERILDRGYSIVFNANGNIIKTMQDTSLGENLQIHLAKGKIGVEVKNIESNK